MIRAVIALLFVSACAPLNHTHTNGHYHTVEDHWHKEPEPVGAWGGFVDDPWGMAKNWGVE